MENNKNKLVVLLSRFPFPLEKGDKLRAYFLIKELSKSFQITLICTSDKSIEDSHIEELKPFCETIHILQLKKWLIPVNLLKSWLNGNPFQVGYFYQSWIKKRINHLLNEIQPDAIFSQLIRTTEYVKDYHDCPKTLDYMDALSKGMERRYEQAKFLYKGIYRSEFQRLINYERRIFDYFENHTIISAQDRDVILHPNHKQIHLIANGVDKRFFQTEEKEKSIDILFTGNMSYPPNVDAAIYLVKKIMPLIWKSIPNCNLVIAGATPSSEVQKLHSERVTITGWVEDIKPYYAQSSVFCAPMRLGSGLQNKLLEAMAMGIPCVTSTIANNALYAIKDKDIIVEDRPENCAKKIIYLLENKNVAKEIGENGKNHVFTQFDWKSISFQLTKIILNKN